MMTFQSQRGSVGPLVAIGILLAVLILGVFLFKDRVVPPTPSGYVPSASADLKVESFKSEEEFKNYLAKSGDTSYFGSGRTTTMSRDLAVPSTGALESSALKTAEGTPDRVSETNVQVKGIDEPDIVKTDGKEIYYSLPSYGIMPMGTMMEGRPVESSLKIYPNPMPIKESGIKAIKAFPPAEIKVDADLPKNGEMLFAGKNLVIFSGDKITGFDVSQPTAPTQEWEFTYSNNSSLVSARLYQDRIFVVTRTGVDYSRPCPVIPLTASGREISIACTQIYHPIAPIPVDTTYSVLTLNPNSGDVQSSASFVGSTDASAVYMSGESIFVAYHYPGDFISYFYGFFKENMDLVGQEAVDHLGRIKDYDISDAAKLAELSTIMQRLDSGSDSDESLRIQNELQNRMEKYAKNHKRELERTGIVKLNSSNLQVVANGSVPGRILNQFSLDEFENNLRIATTIGQNFWGMGGQSESTNDVYVLNANLNPLGAVLDLGLGERIYSARFVGDRGYVVTFRQTDPFYVLDLSSPSAPKKTGELKIPGFSSYLHPLEKHLVLGIGQENSRVKLSLFDVTNPANPVEIDKYSLDEHWTEAANNHHAFLQDAKHQVFFLPGGQGGYIFSYQNKELSLVKAIAGIAAKRSLYINDYLYVLGDQKMVVLNEVDWERVKELTF